MTPTTLNTIEALDTIHRAQRLLDSRKLTIRHANDLNQLTDAVVSFTAFYLRQPEPVCRPEQRRAFDALKSLVIQLEKQ